MKAKKIIFSVAGLTLAMLLFVNTAMAAKPAGNVRPGWGFGDQNHIHTGPPGLSVRPSNARVVNNVNTSASTGGNVIAGGGGTIVTGAVSIVTTIGNFVGGWF